MILFFVIVAFGLCVLAYGAISSIPKTNFELTNPIYSPY